jgi:hypothetical protein
MTIKNTTFIALFLSLLVAAPPSGAQPAKQKKVTSDAAARAAFAKGQQAVKEQQFVSAIEAFQQAYRLRPHYLVMCGIARCYQNLNDMVKAAEHYKRCLKEGAGETKMAHRITASLKVVESLITWLKIRSPGQGGMVFIDGHEAGATPRRVPVNPGLHAIEVRRESARPARAKIKTLGGEEREITLVPEDLAPRVEPGPASQPAASGKDTGAAKKRGLPQYWFWSAAGATVVLAVVAVVLGAQTLGYGSDYKADPTEEAYNKFADQRLLTNIFWAATAVAAGGSTALFFYTDFGGEDDRGGKETTALTFGITWRGSF